MNEMESRRDKEQIHQELMLRLHKLENLNPDISAAEHQEMMALARQLDESCFGEVALQAEHLMKMYLACDVKNAGRLIMLEYFDELKAGARLLQEAGEIDSLQEKSEHATFCTELVPAEQQTALDFCKVLNRTNVPKQLVKAADAFRRRNEVVSTVFEYALRVMWIISPQKAEDWSIALFERCHGDMDPDIARDVIQVALAFNLPISEVFFKQVVEIASDVNLLEYWPTVTMYADRLLCRQGLARYFSSHSAKNILLRELKHLLDCHLVDDERMLSWENRALNGIGTSVQQFISIEKSNLGSEWEAASLVRELTHIADLYIPALLMADQVLSLPDGASQLAMAFMGLAGKSLEAWEEALVRYSMRLVVRKLMMDLGRGRPMEETIRLLTFGDNAAYNAACAELDLASGKFDSMKQRDKVAGLLAVYYASYRHRQLLGVEISRRYRSLMRMIHDDFLSQHLDSCQMESIHATGILPEISSIASEARKFLAKRRAEENNLEQMLAARIAFERFVRQKRIQHL